MKKLALILISLFVASMVFAGERDAKGVFKFHAQGRGVVKFFGTGKIDISGDGALWVVDCSMDNNLNVTTASGETDKTPGFIYAYNGFDGQISLKGGPMKLVFTGKLKIGVIGKGKILLKGVGAYKINDNDQETAWTEDAEEEITIDDAE